MAAPRKRLPDFDLLRGLAILYIVGIRHMDGYAGDIYHCKLDDILAYSLLGLFVFISGYLLQRGMPIIRSGIQIRTFLLRRFLRIYPLYLLALMAFRVCGFITPAELLQQIFLLNIFLNSSVITLWFVSMLCVFYLLYPLLIRFRSPAATLLTTAGLCAIGLVANIAFDLVDFRAIIFLPLFTAGILASRHRLLFTAFRSTPFCIASSLLCLVASIFYFVTPRASSLFMLLFMTTSLPAWFLTARLLTPRLPVRLYATVAYSSYAMYLFHHPLFTTMTRLYQPPGTIATLLYLTLLGLPLLVTMAYGVQKLYDGLITRVTASRRCGLSLDNPT